MFVILQVFRINVRISGCDEAAIGHARIFLCLFFDD